MTNSHFYAHGVEHLSASSINLFIDEPALWILKVAGHTGKVGPAAWRGTAVDRIAYFSGLQPPILERILLDKALEEYDRQVAIDGAGAPEEKIASERDDIPKYVAHCREFYQSLGEEPISEQGKIEIYIGDIEVPFIGFYDLLYKNAVRDTKTTGRMPSKLSEAHARQGAIYAEATGKTAFIDYIGKRGTSSFQVLNHKIYIQQVYYAAKAMELALSRSSDITACTEAFYPNFDNWRWDTESIVMAKYFWNMDDTTITTRKAQ